MISFPSRKNIFDPSPRFNVDWWLDIFQSDTFSTCSHVSTFNIQSIISSHHPNVESSHVSTLNRGGGVMKMINFPSKKQHFYSTCYQKIVIHLCVPFIFGTALVDLLAKIGVDTAENGPPKFGVPACLALWSSADLRTCPARVSPSTFFSRHPQRLLSCTPTGVHLARRRSPVRPASATGSALRW